MYNDGIILARGIFGGPAAYNIVLASCWGQRSLSFSPLELISVDLEDDGAGDWTAQLWAPFGRLVNTIRCLWFACSLYHKENLQVQEVMDV